jgi:hypothetical protein
MKISVISLISYDAEYLPQSIESYYPYVDEIVLGLDQDRISWSNNKFTFDEKTLFKTLKKLDVNNKIKIVQANFHGSKIALENDNYERNYLKSHCTHEIIMSVDADEVLVNAKDFFFNYLKHAKPYLHKADLAFTWFLPYKKIDDNVLMIANDDGSWFKGDTQGFLTHRDRTFTYCRWTDTKKVILCNLGIMHWSFCRTEKSLHQKINNFGHSDRTSNDPFFGVWQQVNMDNFMQLRNFKSSGFGNNQWNRLVPIKSNILQNIAEREAQLIL